MVGGEIPPIPDKEEEEELLLYFLFWFFLSRLSLLCLFWRMLRPQSAYIAGWETGLVGCERPE